MLTWSCDGAHKLDGPYLHLCCIGMFGFMDMEDVICLWSMIKEFDSTYGPAWLCIVETSFGFYVTHSIGGFLYFSIDKLVN
ncbi:uncharacterized protein [Euphorbia lathyris]|uniref:uncharacterized protein n=1 Tax=Euphorbia lathyris TaxID=212925 RepID=UPI003313F569